MHPLHEWDVTPSEARRIQEDLRGQLTLAGSEGPFGTVAGVDASFSGDGSTVMIAPMARWDWSAQRDFKRTMELLESETGLKPVVTEREQSRSLNEPPASG